MHLIAYQPDKIEVASGTVVTWTQQDAGFHTVTSGTAQVEASGAVIEHPDMLYDSGKIAQGKSFLHTFDKAGTYHYFCDIHPATMHGEVIVK